MDLLARYNVSLSAMHLVTWVWVDPWSLWILSMYDVSMMFMQWVMGQAPWVMGFGLYPTTFNVFAQWVMIIKFLPIYITQYTTY